MLPFRKKDFNMGVAILVSCCLKDNTHFGYDFILSNALFYSFQDRKAHQVLFRVLFAFETFMKFF